MMRLSLAFLLSLIAGPTFAHIGHLGEVAGHGHWIALGGIAIAAGIALLGNRKKADEAVEDETVDNVDDEGEPV